MRDSKFTNLRRHCVSSICRAAAKFSETESDDSSSRDRLSQFDWPFKDCHKIKISIYSGINFNAM